LQNIHESEADETVIREGVDAKQYQLLIIKKAVGTRLYSMANSFNHSKLKKRITMMLKEKSSPWARLKYLYVLPLAAIAVTAFARPEVSNELKEISEVKVNDLAAIVAIKEVKSDVAPQDADSGMFDVTQNVVIGSSRTSPQVNETQQTIKSEESEEAMPVLELMEVSTFTAQGAQAVMKETERKNKNNLQISFLENKVSAKSEGMSLLADQIKFPKPQNVVSLHGVPEGKDPLVIIDGKEATLSAMDALRPERIKSISVLKEKSSTDLYGERGRNGVILVELLPGNQEIQSKGLAGNIQEITNKDNPLAPLFILDGKEIADLNIIAPNDIDNIDVYKIKTKETEALFDKYGVKAKNGIVLITSRNHVKGKGQEITISGMKYITNPVEVQGRVVDTNKKPIGGATILISGTNVGTITDMDGKFKLQADKDALLIVSYVGMKPFIIKADKKLKITLEDNE